MLNCYYCDQRRSGGTRFAATTAVAVCRRCGAGVCLEHSHREARPGAAIFCHACAKVELTFPVSHLTGGVRTPVKAAK